MMRKLAPELQQVDGQLPCSNNHKKRERSFANLIMTGFKETTETSSPAIQERSESSPFLYQQLL